MPDTTFKKYLSQQKGRNFQRRKAQRTGRLQKDWVTRARRFEGSANMGTRVPCGEHHPKKGS